MVMEYCVKQSSEIIRRSANYKPNIWKYHFLHSLTTIYHKEEFSMRLEKLIKKARFMFVEENNGVLAKLELISSIQNLGLAYHFQQEIKEALQTLISDDSNFNLRFVDESLYTNALCFRLLRQNGYQVSPGTIFLAGKGSMVKKASSCGGGDVKETIEIFEASHLALEGEDMLDDARTLAINFLKDASKKLHNNNNNNSQVFEQVVHVLDLPSHWRVEWFDVKWHINEHEKRNHFNPTLLQLAKLNFNIIQAQLQEELKELSRWWKNLGLEEELNFARSRLVESFMCAAGVCCEAKFKSLRKWLTKVINFVLVIDDIYDVYASFEELNKFTIAIHRWDVKEVEDLPEYMRVCFEALNSVTIETAQEIAGENQHIDTIIPYIKKAWGEFCEALFVEAKWYKEGYTPCLQQYLKNASISSSGPLILLHIYFATLYQPGHQIHTFLHNNHHLFYNISLIIRLCNDLGTTLAERERGDAASSVVCYMKEKQVTEEAARKHIEEMIKRGWKKINQHYFYYYLFTKSNKDSDSSAKAKFISQATNAARVAHTLYHNNVDGFGIQDGHIRKHILSLFIEPFNFN